MSAPQGQGQSDQSRNIGRYVFMGLAAAGVALVVYTTYQRSQSQQSNYSSRSLSTSWFDESATDINKLRNINVNLNGARGAVSRDKVGTPSMAGYERQTGYQKHFNEASESQLLAVPEKTASVSSMKSADTNLTEKYANFPIGRPLLHLQRTATQPELALSPTFLGESSYRETVIYLLGLAVWRLYPEEELIVQNTFHFGVSRRTYFCSVSRTSSFEFTDKILAQIEAEMQELSRMELELQSKFIDHHTCLEMLTSTNQLLSASLVSTLNRPAYRMVGCEIDEVSYYILQYRSTINNTRYCQKFKLFLSEDSNRNFIVKFPHRDEEMAVDEYKSKAVLDDADSPQKEQPRKWHQPKAIRDLFRHGNELGEFLQINGVADINKVIQEGRFKELMLISEAYHNRQIVKISNKVKQHSEEKKQVRIILISGPSSSGKTTFASKLGIQLRLLGYVPTVLEVDMWFRDRADPEHPRDSKGNLNFEVIEAVKLKEFNENLNTLLSGDKIKVPKFDFKTGSRAGYEKEATSLDMDHGVLIMEGIFCLNPRLLEGVKDVDNISFKIFICPISPFYALDNFHFISEQMIRLIRRISRDHFHRGHDATHTVFKWGQLKEGEDANIFPFVRHADAVFNSSLLYEVSVLKTYSYPLLQTVKQTAKQYKDAQNIIAFLDMFFAMPDRSVPQDSLLMEFIGKSIFDEME